VVACANRCSRARVPSSPQAGSPALSYRILHLADLHLDRAFAGIGCYGEAARRRRQGLRDALRRAGEIAVELGCDLVTLGGDIYEHDRADLETGRFLAELFAAWRPMRVAIAPGNHDALLPGSLWARTEWPDTVHVFTETELSPLPLADGLVLWGLAHREPAWSGDPLEGDPVGGDGGVHLALFHGAELGSRPEGKSGHGPFRAQRIAERGFAVALSGHYHRRRIDPAARLVYPGSPEPLGFDEDGRRGPVMVELGDDGTVSCEALATNAWTALTAGCDVEGLGSAASIVEAVRATAFTAVAGSDPERLMLRVDLRGEVSPDVAVDLPSLEQAAADAAGAAVVRVRDLTTPGVDIAAAAADRTTRGEFTRELLAAIGASGDEAEQGVLRDALRYGLQALSDVEVGLR
jgi:DNA repair protein SbcD/Mre11